MQPQSDESNRVLEVQRATHRDHINNVYRLVFEKLDSDDVRAARHYVYEMDKVPNGKVGTAERSPDQTENLTYENENWLELNSLPTTALNTPYKENKRKA